MFIKLLQILINSSIKHYHPNQIEITYSQFLHFTLTESPDNRVNLFEPHFGQIGQARTGFISAQLALYQIRE